MPKKRQLMQRSLDLHLDSPVTLTTGEQRELIRALALLLLSIAKNENTQLLGTRKAGGHDDHKNHE
jgi:hypothetical protein